MSAMRRAWVKRLTLAVAGAVIATGLAGCDTFLERIKAETSYHHAADVKTEVTTVQPATKKQQQRQFGTVGSNTLRLAVIFYERLLVPKGAALSITVTDAKGKSTTTNIKTTTGLPYRVEVPLGKASTTPLEVEVTLTSPAGHVLSGSKSFATLPNGPAEFLIASGRNN